MGQYQITRQSTISAASRSLKFGILGQRSQQRFCHGHGRGHGTQRPRIDLNKRFLPRPNTTTA